MGLVDYHEKIMPVIITKYTEKNGWFLAPLQKVLDSSFHAIYLQLRLQQKWRVLVAQSLFSIHIIVQKHLCGLVGVKLFSTL